jgi:hypothetical protein
MYLAPAGVRGKPVRAADVAKVDPVLADTTSVTRTNGLTTEGMLGLLFAVLVILLFLLSVRSTLVTAVSIPISVLVALLALWTGDLSLNLLTLGALTIAVGRVVDDSIVVLENIKRHLEYGEDKNRAILDGHDRAAVQAGDQLPGRLGQHQHECQPGAGARHSLQARATRPRRSRACRPQRPKSSPIRSPSARRILTTAVFPQRTPSSQPSTREPT